MSEKVRAIQYGLGPIGCAVARHAAEREGLVLVGGVDVDPAIVGQDVGTVIGLGRPLGFATGVTVLATGVNPGFLMDTLPLALSGICQQVAHIEVRRTIDASTRRGPFQAKIGAGMTVEAFRAEMEAGRMGHVGLPESIGMVFSTLGVTLVRYETEVEPIVGEETIRTEHVEVPPGRVIGLRQVARAYGEEGEFLKLVFVAALEVAEEQDTIAITGTPDLEVTLRGTHGDLATAAIVVNAVRRVREGGPGLVTMRDLPIVTYW